MAAGAKRAVAMASGQAPLRGSAFRGIVSSCNMYMQVVREIVSPGPTDGPPPAAKGTGDPTPLGKGDGMARRNSKPGVKPAWDGIETAYATRGGECAYANLKLVTRVVSGVYDEALRPCGLRASQLALMWAILALEPVDLGRLGTVTLTDQTTLSRTIATLRTAGLVSVRAGEDRRVKIVQLTAAGRARFRAAMPLWEVAQKRASDFLSLDEVHRLGRRVRKSRRAAIAAA